MDIPATVQRLYGSPEAIQAISNFSHNAWGAFLIAIIIFLVLNHSIVRKKWMGYLPPILLIVMATLFVGGMFLNRGISNFYENAILIFSFPHVWVHLIFAGAHISAGAIELYRIRTRGTHQLVRIAFPLVFVVIGILNIAHPHGAVHDHVEAELHAYLGMLLMLSGLFFVLHRLLRDKRAQMFFFLAGILCLFITASILVPYRERASAFTYAFPTTPPSVGSSTIFQGNAQVFVYQGEFIPQMINIPLGSNLTITSLDPQIHDFASGPHPTHSDYPPLNIGIMGIGDSATIPFSERRTYGVHDHLNESSLRLQLTIVVS